MNRKSKIFVYTVFAFALIGILATGNFLLKGMSTAFAWNNAPRHSMVENSSRRNNSMMNNNYHRTNAMNVSNSNRCH